MSDQAYDLDHAPMESTRRHLSARQAETVERLARATVDEVRAAGYDALTVRSVAKRAGVAFSTAYMYFTSKDHLLTEVFWRRLLALPEPAPDHRRGAAARVSAVLADLALLVSDEPELAAACTTALLSPDPEVRVLRRRIGADMRRRIGQALGGDATDDLLEAFDLVVTGALVRAGMGHVTYQALPDHLAHTAQLLLGGRP